MTPKALDNLTVPAELDECQSMIGDLVGMLKQAFGRLDEKDDQILELQERLDLLLRAKYGRSAETYAPGQLRLFEKEQEAKPKPEVKSVAVLPAEERKGKHGRRKPAKELPRRQVVHELPADRLGCPDCGAERKKIGEERSERYGYVPACVEVIEDVRFKYACPKCAENIIIADLPVKPVPKGLADNSMIAYIATSKFADHLPLHRLEGIFQRHGADIVRSTMCDWLGAGGDRLVPLYKIIGQRVLDSRIIWTDDTPVDLQDRDHERNIREARLWAYIGDKENPFIYFDFTESRKRDGPAAFLKDYCGYLQADAYAGYDGIYAGKNVREVACWAHVRRKFRDANQSKANRALRYIQILYRMDKRYAFKSADERKAMRQKRPKRILHALKAWLDREVAIELKGPVAKAIRYALKNWDALNTFLEDGDLTLDNNRAENALRSIAVGRKNWLFVGSREGGRRAAIWSTLIASCKRNNVEPLAYLTEFSANYAQTSRSISTAFFPTSGKLLANRFTGQIHTFRSVLFFAKWASRKYKETQKAEENSLSAFQYSRYFREFPRCEFAN